jgi:hypothetical protein
MGTERTQRQKTDSCSGVSESISAILLVSIVVIAVGTVALLVFSQPVPTKIPALHFMTGVSSSGTTLYLYHNGGDTLNAGEFSVLLDGVPASYTISGGGSQWSLGKNLVVPISQIPNKVTVVYGDSQAGGVSGSTGRFMLDEASANIVNSGNVLPDQLPYLDCSAVKNWDCADQIPPEIISAQYVVNVTTKRVTLMKYGQLGNSIVSNGMVNHLNFTVNDANSSITFGGSGCDTSLKKVPLSIGDKVSVYFNNDPSSLTLYGSAPQIWEMTAGTGSQISTEIDFANGTVWKKPELAAWAICNVYCGGYTNLDSTLVLTTDNSIKATSLTVNKTVYIDGVNNSSVIRLTNFKPTDNGLFLIIYSSSSTAAFYVVGWADTISGLTPPLGLGL